MNTFEHPHWLPPMGNVPALPGRGLENVGHQDEAEILSIILSQPYSAGAEPCLLHFCRLKGVEPPRRGRAIFDVLVKAGQAKDFQAARAQVVAYLRDYLDMPL